MYHVYCNICKREVIADLVWTKTYQKSAKMEHHYICLSCKGNFTIVYSKEKQNV